MTSFTHYHILEVTQNASQAEIKQAYRRLAKRFHPDSKSEIANHDQIVRINAAYEVLGDPQRRRTYDQQLVPNYPSVKRQQRTAYAQYHYQRRRNADASSAGLTDEWLKNVYLPIEGLISQIIYRLDEQVDELAADPFDDELMEIFQNYLGHCRDHLRQAKYIFSTQPNPAKLAKVAAALYYCLSQLEDGIDELDWFSGNYDDSHLHMGQELFRIVHQLLTEAKEIVEYERS
ncbi:MAG: DnaJ domain-containing protein [Cyanobacteria bacterium P01_G01_bin.49]